MGPDDIHSRGQRELADMIAKPHCHIGKVTAIRQSSWCLDKGKHHSHFKMVRKEGPINCRPVSLTYVLGKMVEQILLEVMLRHM